MTFQYSPTDHAATDAAIGLRIGPDRTFYDDTTVRLKLRDECSGRSWTFAIGTVEAQVTYETPDGPHASRLVVSATLPRRDIEDILPELIAARRALGRELEIADAINAIQQGAFVYLARGDAMLKFVPDFKVTWGYAQGEQCGA